MLEGFLEECLGKAGEEFTEKTGRSMPGISSGQLGEGTKPLQRAAKGSRNLFHRNPKECEEGSGSGHRLGRKRGVGAENAGQGGVEAGHGGVRPDRRDQYLAQCRAGYQRRLFLYGADGELSVFPEAQPGSVEIPQSEPGPQYLSEMLFASPTPSFKGFALSEEGKLVFRFGEQEQYPEKIRQIQTGILDFVEDWKRFFGSFKEEGWGTVSGRDAYAPVLCMLEDVRYQKALKKEYSWNTNRNVE